MVQMEPDKFVNDLVSKHDTVQTFLEDLTFEMASTAETELVEHRVDGHAQIDWERGDVDWFITLSDDRGQKAALSIEYGREPYVDENGRKVGGMEGLFILTKATGIPVRGKRQKGTP